MVRSGVRGLIDAVAGADEQAAQALDDGLEFDYSRPAEKPDCRWREKAERERMLTRVAEDAERALRAVERADGLLAEDAVREAHSLLRELVGHDFDVDAAGGAAPSSRHAPGPDHLDGRPRDPPRAQVEAPALRRLQALGRGHQHP
jgi:hypothetical protein